MGPLFLEPNWLCCACAYHSVDTSSPLATCQLGDTHLSCSRKGHQQTFSPACTDPPPPAILENSWDEGPLRKPGTARNISYDTEIQTRATHDYTSLQEPSPSAQPSSWQPTVSRPPALPEVAEKFHVLSCSFRTARRAGQVKSPSANRATRWLNCLFDVGFAVGP